MNKPYYLDTVEIDRLNAEITEYQAEQRLIADALRAAAEDNQRMREALVFIRDLLPGSPITAQIVARYTLNPTQNTEAK